MIKEIQYWNHMYINIMNMVPEIQKQLLNKHFKFNYYSDELEGEVMKLWFSEVHNQLWVRLFVKEKNFYYNTKASELYE